VAPSTPSSPGGLCGGTAARQVAGAGSHRVPVQRPRARTLDGHEVRLSTWHAFTGEDLAGKLVMGRMLAGLANRRHPQAAEPVGEVVEQSATAPSRSAISRQFAPQSATSRRRGRSTGTDAEGYRSKSWRMLAAVEALPRYVVIPNSSSVVRSIE
jgi:hypothetical protein